VVEVIRSVFGEEVVKERKKDKKIKIKKGSHPF
jgi:hypothetical protein